MNTIYGATAGGAPWTPTIKVPAEDFTPKRSNPTPDYYNKTFNGAKLDPYRIAEIYGITDHSLFQALKKILVCGKRGSKDIEQDLREAHAAIERKLEMLREDNPHRGVCPEWWAPDEKWSIT